MALTYIKNTSDLPIGKEVIATRKLLGNLSQSDTFLVLSDVLKDNFDGKTITKDELFEVYDEIVLIDW